LTFTFNVKKQHTFIEEYFAWGKCVDPGFHSIPLHHIKLKSNFVVGVGHTLPVDDISLLFDIDMVGDKVIMAAIISEDPSN
jgi:hypothetical protein